MASLSKPVMTGLPELKGGSNSSDGGGCSKQDYGGAEGSISMRSVFVYLQQNTEQTSQWDFFAN